MNDTSYTKTGQNEDSMSDCRGERFPLYLVLDFEIQLAHVKKVLRIVESKAFYQQLAQVIDAIFVLPKIEMVQWRASRQTSLRTYRVVQYIYFPSIIVTAIELEKTVSILSSLCTHDDAAWQMKSNSAFWEFLRKELRGVTFTDGRGSIFDATIVHDSEFPAPRSRREWSMMRDPVLMTYFSKKSVLFVDDQIGLEYAESLSRIDNAQNKTLTPRTDPPPLFFDALVCREDPSSSPQNISSPETGLPTKVDQFCKASDSTQMDLLNQIRHRCDAEREKREKENEHLKRFIESIQRVLSA